MLKLITAWIAMGFRRPEITLGKTVHRACPVGPRHIASVASTIPRPLLCCHAPWARRGDRSTQRDRVPNGSRQVALVSRRVRQHQGMPYFSRVWADYPLMSDLNARARCRRKPSSGVHPSAQRRSLGPFAKSSACSRRAFSARSLSSLQITHGYSLRLCIGVRLLISLPLGGCSHLLKSGIGISTKNYGKLVGR
jgi:hypothetical protein